MSGGEDVSVADEGAAAEGLAESPVRQPHHPRELVRFSLKSPDDSATSLMLLLISTEIG